MTTIAVTTEQYTEQKEKTLNAQLVKYQKELAKLDCKAQVLRDLISALTKQLTA